MRESLGHKYVEELRGVYSDRLPGGSDLVCYWFEKARAMVQSGHTKRVGLLATQAIRGGTNRRVLERIKTSGDIFWAQSDRNWVLDGADVHVSMIGFDNGEEQSRELDGKPVVQINADLSSSASDLTQAKVLNQNRGIAFIGTQKGGSFDLDENVASTMLGKTGNPNGRPNSEVIKPWINGSDLTGKTRGKWIIDFGISLSRREAAQYEAPFEHVQKYVYPSRKNLRREGHRTKWWIHAESRPGMRYALGGKTRFIVTTRHSKHRIFNWEPIGIVPDSALVVFARDDDYFFGVLQSSVHELWARRKGTQVRDVESGFRYTPTSTFETFPMPWSAGHEPDNDELNNIATAACQLVKKRDRWLNPPGALAEELRKRTLTGLYNESPTWLKDAHHELNEAVFAAYGWPNDLSDDAILTRLLQLNTTRHADEQGRIVPAQPEEPAIAAVPKKLVGSATEEKRPRPRKARRASKSVRRQVS